MVLNVVITVIKEKQRWAIMVFCLEEKRKEAPLSWLAASRQTPNPKMEKKKKNTSFLNNPYPATLPLPSCPASPTHPGNIQRLVAQIGGSRLPYVSPDLGFFRNVSEGRNK